MKKTYISGGMTNYIDNNYSFFIEKAKELKNLGYDTLNPATDIKPIDNQNKKVSIDDLISQIKDGTVEENIAWKWFLRGDIISIVKDCDSIYLTKGWLASKGARFERYVAKKMGLKMIKQRPMLIEVIASGIILFMQKVLKIKLKKPI